MDKQTLPANTSLTASLALMIFLLVSCGGSSSSQDDEPEQKEPVTSMRIQPSLGNIDGLKIEDIDVQAITSSEVITLPKNQFSISSDARDGDSFTVGGLDRFAVGARYKITLRGNPDAEYFDEAAAAKIPFTQTDYLRVYLPEAQEDVALTSLTTIAAATLDKKNSPSAEEIKKINNAIAKWFANLGDITKPAFPFGPDTNLSDLPDDDSGRYAAMLYAIPMLNPMDASPALTSLRQVKYDSLDGVFDGRKFGTGVSYWDIDSFPDLLNDTFSNNSGLDFLDLDLTKDPDNKGINNDLEDPGSIEVDGKVRAYKDSSDNRFVIVRLQTENPVNNINDWTIFALPVENIAGFDSYVFTVQYSDGRAPIQVSTGIANNATRKIEPTRVGNVGLFAIASGNVTAITVTNTSPVGQSNIAEPSPADVVARKVASCAFLTILAIQEKLDKEFFRTPPGSIANGLGGTLSADDSAEAEGLAEAFYRYPCASDKGLESPPIIAIASDSNGILDTVRTRFTF